MNDLKNRLDILKNAKQIEEDSYELGINVIKVMKDKYEYNLTESNGAMLITHIVMSNERIKNNNPVEQLNPDIANDLLNHCNYEKAKKIVESIIELMNENFVEAERDYILMHVLTAIGA